MTHGIKLKQSAQACSVFLKRWRNSTRGGGEERNFGRKRTKYIRLVKSNDDLGKRKGRDATQANGNFRHPTTSPKKATRTDIGLSPKSRAVGNKREGLVEGNMAGAKKGGKKGKGVKRKTGRRGLMMGARKEEERSWRKERGGWGRRKNLRGGGRGRAMSSRAEFRQVGCAFCKAVRWKGGGGN